MFTNLNKSLSLNIIEVEDIPYQLRNFIYQFRGIIGIGIEIF